MRETQYTETWVDIGDKRECPDCKQLGGESRPKSYWDETGRPRSRNTICDGNCRCMLVPDVPEGSVDFDKMIDEVIDKYMGKVVVDKVHGGYNTVLLKDFEQVKGLSTLPYSKIAELEDLIFEYKREGAALPGEYYKLADVEKQIEWLKNNT